MIMITFSVVLLATSINAQRPLAEVTAQLTEGKARPDDLAQAQSGTPHDPTTDVNVSECWKCNGKSYSECQSTGAHETCHTSGSQSASCYLREIKRYSPQQGGFVTEMVEMGCMETDNCTVQKEQNFQFGLVTSFRYKYNRCKPEGRWRNSDCFQCCADQNNCMYSPGPTPVAIWIPAYIEEWAYGI